MKRISIALVLMLAASQASATVVNNAMKKKAGATNPAVNVVIPPVVPQVVSPPPAPSPVVFVQPAAQPQPNTVASKKAGKNKVEAPVVFFQQQVRLDDLVCEEPPKGGGDNVSAVPVPAALPLMATALGIFGITRRRKAFK